MAKIDKLDDLECCKVAREFRKVAIAWSRSLAKSEDYRLIDQIIRAIRSITSNIAEGFGQHHPQENLQFCRVSRGSMMEKLEHLNTALMKDIGTETYQELRARLGKFGCP